MSQITSGYQATIDWYEHNAEAYADQIMSLPDNDQLDEFIEKLDIGAKILDAGCAAGRDCRIFKDRGLSPVGVDITHSLIQEARKRNPDIEFKEGSFLDLPFSDSSFDGVWAHASLVHFETISEVKQALREFHRVLKQSGIIHISVKEQLGTEKTESVAHNFSGDFKRFFRFFTKDEVEELLKEAGFKIVSLKQNASEKRIIQWIVILAQKV